MNTTRMECRQRLDAALAIARKAGTMLLEIHNTKDFKISEKATNDYVTEADKKCENFILQELSARFPTDSFHCEESGNSGISFPRWIIDPIDGTMNFMRGMPNFAISIGWEQEPGKPLLGVVYNVKQNEMFSAIVGEGAFLNDIRIHVSDISEACKAIVVCEAPHRFHAWSHAYYTLWEKIFNQSSDLRCFGSIALELCYIAAGMLDAVFEYNLGYWDIAAGVAILQAAGGTVEPIVPTDNLSREPCDIIATNSLLQPWLNTVVREAGSIRS